MDNFGLKELTREESINTNGGILGSIIIGLCIGAGIAIVAWFASDVANGSSDTSDE
jgi:hypothetical protein